MGNLGRTTGGKKRELLPRQKGLYHRGDGEKVGPWRDSVLQRDAEIYYEKRAVECTPSTIQGGEGNIGKGGIKKSFISQPDR